MDGAAEWCRPSSKAQASGSEAEAAIDWGEIVPSLVAFYGGDPLKWFAVYPLWLVTAFTEMLAPLKAEQQLRQIEAVSVPHMKQDAAQSLIRRLARRISRERPKTVAEQLMAHMKVNYVPTPTPKKKVTDGG